ncbi:MAG: hypothetical protein CMJ18_25815 [Phycisphaeraceae bacterium]|nr:hypothetical protein [Phycisphaeraceae bacterium]
MSDTNWLDIHDLSDDEHLGETIARLARLAAQLHEQAAALEARHGAPGTEVSYIQTNDGPAIAVHMEVNR